MRIKLREIIYSFTYLWKPPKLEGIMYRYFLKINLYIFYRTCIFFIIIVQEFVVAGIYKSVCWCVLFLFFRFKLRWIIKSDPGH